MVTLARNRFWLDGGYDRDAVEACQHHPHHKWWVFRLGDVLDVEYMGIEYQADDFMVVCRGCYVPRCGDAEKPSDPDPCLLPRHHPEPHQTAGGAHWPIGGTRPF